MRKLISLVMSLCALLLIVSFTIPKANAAGGYVASKTSNVYHTVDCHYVQNINKSNLISFRTKADAENSGRRPCSSCIPDKAGSSFSYGETSKWTSSDPYVQDQLEDENRLGYEKGYKEAKAKYEAEKKEMKKAHEEELTQARNDNLVAGGIGAAISAVGTAMICKRKKNE